MGIIKNAMDHEDAIKSSPYARLKSINKIQS